MKKTLIVIFVIMSSFVFAYPQESSTEFTLDASIGYALKHSKAMLIQEQKLKDAKGQEISAFAGFIPSFAITGSRMTIETPESIPLGGMNLIFMAKDTYSYGLTVQQNIFTSGKLLNAYGISKANMRATRAEYTKTQGDTIFETTRSFYALLLAQKMAGLIEDTYNQTEQRLNQVQAYYDNGIVSKLDLLRMKVQLANLKTQLTKTRDGLELAKDAFKMTTGMPAETKVELKGEFKFEEIAVNTDEAIRNAIENKPDLKMLEERENILRKSLAMTIEGNGPNIVAIYSNQRTNPYLFQDIWGSNWNVVLQLQWPIGLAGYGRVKSSKAQYEQIKYGLEQMKEATILEAKQVCMTLSQEKENIAIQNENTALAEEAMKIADERYKSGIISSLEYMDAQISLTQAKTNYFQAIANYATAKAQLQKITGK
jgi:outer membrane protein